MSMSERWTIVHLWQTFGNLTKTKIGLTMFYQRCDHFLFSCPVCVFFTICPHDLCKVNTFQAHCESWMMRMSEGWKIIYHWKVVGKLTNFLMHLTIIFQMCNHNLFPLPIFLFLSISAHDLREINILETHLWVDWWL